MASEEIDPTQMTEVPKAGTPEYDAVEEALTDIWMANSLCITFLVLNSIAFACAVFAAPVVARGFAAQGIDMPGLLATAVNLAMWLRAIWPVTLGLYLGSQLAAVVVQLAWPARKKKIRLFFWASLIPAAVTLYCCLAALLAAF